MPTNERHASNILWLQVSRIKNLRGMKPYSFKAIKWESLAHQIESAVETIASMNLDYLIKGRQFISQSHTQDL